MISASPITFFCGTKGSTAGLGGLLTHWCESHEPGGLSPSTNRSPFGTGGKVMFYSGVKAPGTTYGLPLTRVTPFSTLTTSPARPITRLTNGTPGAGAQVEIADSGGENTMMSPR